MPTTKRTYDEVMEDVFNIYQRLSPENWIIAGETINEEIKARSKKLFTRLFELEKEIGHTVEHDEAYDWYYKKHKQD